MIAATAGPWGDAEQGGMMVARQIDHAHVSGAVAAAWRKPARFSDAAWDRFVQAVAGHDDGWLASDTAPSLDEAGRPRDFLHMPDTEHLAIWHRGSDHWASRDALGALMVTLHSLWLAQRMPPLERAADQPRYEQFIEHWTQQVAAWRALLADDPDAAPLLDHETLTECRRLVGWFDLLSLVLLGAMPGRTYTSPVWFGEAREVVTWRVVADRAVALSPWPLLDDGLMVRCAVTMLERSRFESVGEYRDAIRRGPRVELAWTLVRP